ncbi:hypothetical protein [Entomospira culicis]|uniref:hypothetical protein n=1 Tax=Entomospira culicis TaxID=2719989 RepID=UPI00236862D2|nr:hypothetical protein [Entomospira culicis]WDI36951.1 hypothetical protein PVA46_06410 [Entomospira culicis]WDI38580.1 hypothetical protein PVA47_06420 [Entomospira culicis]
MTISIFMLSLSVTAQAPRRGAFAWHAILDFEESASKEELFDLLLAELFFSADFGFKAKDIQYSTAGIPEIGDQPLFMAQGEIIPTANFLDFAIIGGGFFKIQTPDGIKFTRNGNFRLNAQNLVVTEEGHALVPSLQIDRADVPLLTMDASGKTLQLVKDGMVRDLYDFELYLPSDVENGVLTENKDGFFLFADSSRTSSDYQIQSRSLELSTVKVERILARLSDLLFKIKQENPQGDYDFRFYMLDHLLKSQLQMGQTAQSIKRFSDLVKGVAPLMLFDQETANDINA